MKKVILCLFPLLFCELVYGQTSSGASQPKETLKQQEDSLKYWAYKVINDLLESDRLQANRAFIKTFTRVLKQPGSFYYPFDSIKNINILNDPVGNKFRIVTWYVTMDNQECRFYGAIQMNNPDKTELYPLHDQTKTIIHTDSIFSNTNWLGVVYYTIIPPDKPGDPYMLLGWKGIDNRTTQRMIEPFRMEETRAVFGAPVIVKGKGQISNRLTFEYAKSASMLLKYIPEKKMIVFDHLILADNNAYAPDLSYDALKYQNGKWYYQSDVPLHNAPDPRDEIYTDPRKTNKNQPPISGGR